MNKMNNAKLKYFFLLLSLGFSQTIFSQGNKFGYTLEYIPSLTRLTQGEEIEKFNYGYNAVFRISYNTKANINPTVGLGFLNTGGIQIQDFSRELFQGQVEIKNNHNYNYLYIPIGAKINFSKFYVLPEIGFGIIVSNRIKQIKKYPIVSDERIIEVTSLDLETFSPLTIPLILSIGKDFKLGNYSFSTGVKGYYGLNQIARNQQRNDHYFGFGLILAMNL